MGKRTLVTGGAGFIGSHLVDKLIDEGWEVDLVDDLSSGYEENVRKDVPADRVFICDFSSEVILNRIKEKTYDIVFHIAAVPRVSFSVAHPLLTHDVNVTKTLALIDACRGNVKRIVFASSSSVYGGADILPTPVSYQKSPKSPYALQKSVIEDYLVQYWEHYGLDSVSLRFFNVFGPRQLGGSPYSTAVSSWLTCIKTGQSMRSDGDGSQTRDLCYVDNVTDACYKSAIVKEPLRGRSFNVACGDRTSNKQILEALLKRYPGASWHSSPWRAGDVMHTQADISETSEVLGYVPVVKFWEGLERTINWYEENWEAIKNYESKKC